MADGDAAVPESDVGGPLGSAIDFSDDEDVCDRRSEDAANVGAGQLVLRSNSNEDGAEDEVEVGPELAPPLVVGVADSEQLTARAAVVGCCSTNGATRDTKRRRLTREGGKVVHDHCVNRLVDVGKHFPVYTKSRANCKLCYLLHKKECQSTWMCNECEGPIPLCLNKKRNCFLTWHTTD